MRLKHEMSCYAVSGLGSPVGFACLVLGLAPLVPLVSRLSGRLPLHMPYARRAHRFLIGSVALNMRCHQ